MERETETETLVQRLSSLTTDERMKALTELRENARAELARTEATANVYRHEQAVFDELLRHGEQGREDQP